MTLIRSATIVMLLGAATIGGLLYSYSSFTMRGLRTLPAREAVLAMQAVNLVGPRGAFVVILMGTAAGSAALGIHAVIRHDQPGWGWRLAGAVLYLATIAVTAGFHIPRNNAMALINAESVTVDGAWRDYIGPWVVGNHVRVVTCLGAIAAYAISLIPGKPA